jgi:hypothetical protein
MYTPFFAFSSQRFFPRIVDLSHAATAFLDAKVSRVDLLKQFIFPLDALFIGTHLKHCSFLDTFVYGHVGYLVVVAMVDITSFDLS